MSDYTLGNDRPAFDLPLIEVTPHMIAAGLVELRDHSLADDMRQMVEGVYRAMEYARLNQRGTSVSASAITPSK